MDLEEYNFAYALWLREEGWDVEDGEVPAEDGEGTDGDESAEARQKKKAKKVRLL